MLVLLLKAQINHEFLWFFATFFALIGFEKCTARLSLFNVSAHCFALMCRFCRPKVSSHQVQWHGSLRRQLLLLPVSDWTLCRLETKPIVSMKFTCLQRLKNKWKTAILINEICLDFFSMLCCCVNIGRVFGHKSSTIILLLLLLIMVLPTTLLNIEMLEKSGGIIYAVIDI